jgi:hypothetical protein
MRLMIGLSSSVGLSIGGVYSEGCWTWSLYIYFSLCMLHTIHWHSVIYDIPIQSEVPLSACSEVKDVEFLSPIQERHFQFSQVCGNQPRVHPKHDLSPLFITPSPQSKQSRCSQLSEPLLGLLPDLPSLRLSYKSPSPWQSDSYLPVSPVPLSLSYHHYGIRDHETDEKPDFPQTTNGSLMTPKLLLGLLELQITHRRHWGMSFL